MNTYTENATGRTVKAGQMPANPSAVELLAMRGGGGGVSIGPGDWLIWYQDDLWGQMGVVTDSAFAAQYTAVP